MTNTESIPCSATSSLEVIDTTECSSVTDEQGPSELTEWDKVKNVIGYGKIVSIIERT